MENISKRLLSCTYLGWLHCYLWLYTCLRLIFIFKIILLINMLKLSLIDDQNLSPLILRAKSISLDMQVTLRACATHKLASSNNDTMAASVASWSAWSAALWNLNSVSNCKSFKICRTKLNAKFTSTMERCFLHKQFCRSLIAFDFSQCSFSRSWSSLLYTCLNGSTLSSNFLRCKLLFVIFNFFFSLLAYLWPWHLYFLIKNYL